MRSLRNFLFAIFFLFTSGIGAQTVFVARDFENCGVGLKDSANNWVVPPIYNGIQSYNQFYYQVTLGEKVGIITPDGKIVIPAIYDEVHLTGRGKTRYFEVKLDSKLGLRDSTNAEILPTEYDQVTLFSDGSYTAKKDGKG